MRHLLIATTTALLLAAPTSARADFLGGVGTYFKDRFHDLLDVVRLRGGIPEEGKGIGAKAKVTSLAQVGYVQFRGKMAGMERRALGVTAERRTEGGISLLYASSHEMRPYAGNSFLRADTPWSEAEDRRIIRNLPYWDDGRRRFLGVGAEVATPILALDAGVYPEEALDFVLGWVGIDIYDDDELFLADTGGVDDLREPARPRCPDTSAPFRTKRAELQEFDERMKVEEALSDEPMALETEAAPVTRPAAAPAAPEAPPAADAPPAPRAPEDDKPGIGTRPPGSISDADADRALRLASAG